MSGDRFSAVIFDFGGVFTTSPVERFAAFEQAYGLPDRFLGTVIKTNHHENAWAQYERAEIDLEAFDHLFAEETRRAGYEVSGRKLVSLLSLTLRPTMIAAPSRVKAGGYKTGCITNNLPALEPTAMLAADQNRAQAKSLFEQFDHVIESSKAGVRKPEPRIYEMMIEALAVPAAACVFLDDLGINLKPARDLGMTTIKVPLGDVEPAIDELSALLGLALR